MGNDGTTTADDAGWHGRCARGFEPGRCGLEEVSLSTASRKFTPSPHRSLTLKQRARAFRHHPTASEALLWQHLKAKQLGVQFRRQVVVGDFIADFVASSIRLIVEVDGGYHERRLSLDARREQRLERAGYRAGSGRPSWSSRRNACPMIAEADERWGRKGSCLLDGSIGVSARSHSQLRSSMGCDPPWFTTVCTTHLA